LVAVETLHVQRRAIVLLRDHVHVFGKMVTFDTLKNLKRLFGFGFEFLNEPFPPEVADVLPPLGKLLLAL